MPPPAPPAGRRLRRDVVLECMNELVAQHMVSFGKRSGQRQHDAPLQSFGDTAGAFADHAADDVGLLEVGVRGVEDERLARAHLVLEDAREARVPALGHAADARGVLALFFVEIDVEVLGLEHLELEFLVLDLVAPEILRLGGRCGRQEQAGRPTDRRGGFGEISAAW